MKKNNLVDISEYTFSERFEHYKDSYGVYDENNSIQDRFDLSKFAYQAASGEMLDEIHAMLRHLLKESADTVQPVSDFENKKNGKFVDDYGNEFWYKDGKQHREDGPAVTYEDGSVEYWLNGEFIEK